MTEKPISQEAAQGLLAALRRMQPAMLDARDRFVEAGDMVCATALTISISEVRAAIAKAEGRDA